MRTINALIKRLLRARGLVLLLALVPVTVFSLVLNDRREFVVVADLPAKAFAAAAQSTGAGPQAAIAGLVIRPRVPGEAPRRRIPEDGGPLQLVDPAAGRAGALAFTSPGNPAPAEYVPGQAAQSIGGRGLPTLRQVDSLTGGGIGQLAAAEPSNPGGPSGIPEPESWALMTLGLAIVGFAMRRRAAAGSVSLA